MSSRYETTRETPTIAVGAWSPRPGRGDHAPTAARHYLNLNRAGAGLLLALLLLLTPSLIAQAAQGEGAAPRARPAALAWSGFAPADWVAALPTAVQVTADAPGGFVDASAAYAISSDGGATWSAWTTAGLTLSGSDPTRTLAVSGLSWPDSLTQNLVRFAAEEAGGALEVSPDYTVRVDTTAPASTVSSPAAGAVLRSAPAIAGAAADATAGVAAVAISLRADATGQNWNGAAWVAGEQWLPAVGTVAWSYAGTQPAWADGGSYTVRSRASDAAGIVETPGPGVTFTYDITPPAVTVLAPNGGEVVAGGRPVTITWSAADAVGLPAAPITLSFSLDGGTNWQVIAAAVAHTGSYAWTPPAVDSNQALIEVAALDRAGNRAADRSNAFFNIDSSPPGTPQALQATPAGWSNVASFGLTWSNPPDLGQIVGAWYKLDSAPNAPNDGVFVATANTLSGIAPATDGSHAVYVWLQDSLGRADHTRTASATLYLDRVAPWSPVDLQGEPARTWTNVNRFTERFSIPPDLSGVVAAYYRLNAPGQSPTDGILVSLPVTGALQGRIDNIEVPADGVHDLFIWLVDAAGNKDQRNRNLDQQVFWFDGTAPASSVAFTPAPGPGGWYSATVSALFSASDGSGGSGADAVFNQLDGTGWSTLPSLLIIGEGRHKVEHYAHDVAGNLEPTQTLTVSIDLTPPTVSLTPDRLPNAAGWYTAPLTITLRVSDTLSGAGGGFYRLNSGAWQHLAEPAGQLTLASDGVYTIEAFGEDAAGNRSPVRSLQARLDATPPATAYLPIEGSQGLSGWYTSTLTIRLIPSDSGSGVGATTYRVDAGAWLSGTQFSLTADGIYTVAFFSTDRAGNVEAGFPVQVRLDTAAPSAPSAVEVTPTGWSRTNRFSVQWANPTDLSGIAGIFYRLEREPAGPEDGAFSPITNRLDNLIVPGEGVYQLHLWLRDGAGNADQHNRALAPLLRYDATPPTTTLHIQGTAGDDGWYRSTITVTLDAADASSGVAATRYRLNNGVWSATAGPLVISSPDKHVLEFASEDLAGNVEATHLVTLRIDPDPPSAPLAVRAEPSGWQSSNAFRLTWREPLDRSGIAGVYVRFDSPPAGPTDGTFYGATEWLEGLQVPGEGQHDVYLWLRDGAGNSSCAPAAAVALPSALWYDGTPPTTTVTVTGLGGQSGWYVGPVTFDSTASDLASGLAATRWQFDGAPWADVTGGAFTVTAQGRHTVRIASWDVAGNGEPPRSYEIAIDGQPPTAEMVALPHYQASTRFAVAWSGSDPAGGAGLAGFDVQVRDGLTGAWQTWLSNTTDTSATFDGQRGHSYAFRVRARDRAGNVQAAYATSGSIVVEVLRNGSFDSGNFSEWAAGGLLRKAVVPMIGPGGISVLAARLGSEDYGPSLEDPGSVPVGAAAISQTLTVPTLAQVSQPTLTFWYRVISYDVLYSQRLARIVDSLDVTLTDPAGQPLGVLFRGGNPTDGYGTRYDTGWHWVTADLAPWAGQTVVLTFANWNRHDNLFNTWSYVDDIRVADWPYNERIYLPLTVGSPATPAAAAAAAEPARTSAGNKR